MSNGLSPFRRWHRVASENIIVATQDKSHAAVRRASDAGVKAFDCASSDLERALAIGLIRTALDMSMLLMCSGKELDYKPGDLKS